MSGSTGLSSSPSVLFMSHNFSRPSPAILTLRQTDWLVYVTQLLPPFSRHFLYVRTDWPHHHHQLCISHTTSPALFPPFSPTSGLTSLIITISCVYLTQLLPPFSRHSPLRQTDWPHHHHQLCLCHTTSPAVLPYVRTDWPHHHHQLCISHTTSPALFPPFSPTSGLTGLIITISCVYLTQLLPPFSRHSPLRQTDWPHHYHQLCLCHTTSPAVLPYVRTDWPHHHHQLCISHTTSPALFPPFSPTSGLTGLIITISCVYLTQLLPPFSRHSPLRQD